MRKILKLSAALVSLCLSGAAMADTSLEDQQKAQDKGLAQIAPILKQPGEVLNNIGVLCYPTRDALDLMRTMPNPPPTRVFDNVYFVGTGHVSSWAIKTSAGIILFDTLDNPQEADQFILGGLKKLGFDPNSVKYIVVTHGHGDHYGGALELQKKIPGVHLLMSATDYDLADKTFAEQKTFKDAPAPKHDMTVTDGQKLTLGDETVTLYMTPGHTPGTVSAMIPVMDHGVPRTMALWGGSPFGSKALEPVFYASIKRFRDLMAANHVAGRMSNHALWDNSTIKLEKLRDNPGGPNPYLESASDMKRYGEIQDICLKVQESRLTR